MAPKRKVVRSSKRKQRVLPPGTGTTDKPFWWPVNLPYAPPPGLEPDIWWRMCANEIQALYNSFMS